MKKCSKCLKSKKENEFYSHGKYLQSWCKLCANSYKKVSRLKTRKKDLKKKKEWHKKIQKENRIQLFNYLKEHPCVDCGESDPVVLEFDHFKNKSYEVSKMQWSYTWPRILEEINKCEVRCSNCHKRKTAKQFNYYAYL